MMSGGNWWRAYEIGFIQGAYHIGSPVPVTMPAGLFVNLVPVFGAILAVALLNEPFGIITRLHWRWCSGAFGWPSGRGDKVEYGP